MAPHQRLDGLWPVPRDQLEQNTKKTVDHLKSLSALTKQQGQNIFVLITALVEHGLQYAGHH